MFNVIHALFGCFFLVPAEVYIFDHLDSINPLSRILISFKVVLEVGHVHHSVVQLR